MTDLEYDETGKVSLDPSDWARIPYHIRITNHPIKLEEMRSRGCRNRSNNQPTRLDPEEIEAIRRKAASGQSAYRISLEYGIGQRRVRTILEKMSA